MALDEKVAEKGREDLNATPFCSYEIKTLPVSTDSVEHCGTVADLLEKPFNVRIDITQSGFQQAMDQLHLFK